MSGRILRAGLIGSGIQQSSSPSIHVEEGKAHGLQVCYELFDFDLIPGGAAQLGALLDKAEKNGFCGVNVTYPSKQAVIPLLHELSPEARALHSVNTVLFKDGKRIGHNTDWWGFAQSFKRDMSDVQIDDIVLIGAGGAGAAVGYAMLKLGSKRLIIRDTDVSRAIALSSRLRELFDSERSGSATICPRRSRIHTGWCMPRRQVCESIQDFRSLRIFSIHHFGLRRSCTCR
jgi:shikimate dehydrogenase